MLVLRGILVYAVSYSLYWLVSFAIGSPHDFRHLWDKAALPLLVFVFVVYFNRTSKRD